MSFSNIYNVKYRPYMHSRADTFAKILEYLEGKGPFDKINGYKIIETGCTRNPDIMMSMSGDGCSSVLYDDFLKCHNGHLYTVDINPTFVDTCRKLVSDKTTVTCMDSIEYLHKLSLTETWKADLIYLDSYDFDWNNTFPSSFHHMKELVAVKPFIGPGTLLVIDDNMNSKGKGMFVAEYFKNIKVEPLFSAYQIGWIC